MNVNQLITNQASTAARTTMRLGSKATLLLKKHSPEILLVVGVAGVIGTTVLACKATLGIESVLDKRQDNLDKINEYKAMRDNGEIVETDENAYTEEIEKRDYIMINTRTVMDIAWLYLPAITLGVASIGCIIGSHAILSKRNGEIMATCVAISEAFKTYRERVKQEYGEETDYMFKHGIRKETITETITDEKGKIKEITKDIYTKPGELSQFAKFFDDSCAGWSNIPEYNLTFLRSQQSYFNDLLLSKGFVFLNDVYKALGIKETSAGAVCGWVINKEGDNFVDFGLYDDRNSDFINGFENNIILDFNVDGVIYDKIWERDGLNAIGSGNFYRDIFDYPDLYFHMSYDSEFGDEDDWLVLDLYAYLRNESDKFCI